MYAAQQQMREPEPKKLDHLSQPFRRRLVYAARK
jgi:hypothetical protein